MDRLAALWASARDEVRFRLHDRRVRRERAAATINEFPIGDIERELAEAGSRMAAELERRFDGPMRTNRERLAAASSLHAALGEELAVLERDHKAELGSALLAPVVDRALGQIGTVSPANDRNLLERAHLQDHIFQVRAILDHLTAEDDVRVGIGRDLIAHSFLVEGRQLLIAQANTLEGPVLDTEDNDAAVGHIGHREDVLDETMLVPGHRALELKGGALLAAFEFFCRHKGRDERMIVTRRPSGVRSLFRG